MRPPDPRGVVIDEADGEHVTLVFDRVYRHAPARVWDAIATPEGLRGWLMATDVELDPRVGGRIAMHSGPARYQSEGAILAWDPPTLLEYEWNVAPVPEMPRGERATFRYELTPVRTDPAAGPATHLRVTYRRITRATSGGFLPGLHAFLDRLAAQLEGAPLPDWLARFADARISYPQWSGHAPAAGQ
jgi:uncharacterized protein YndB with AHSA1/START domain